uniref:Uncharacterized protein n=1 Tax=Strombidium inclinatum TaxID=197538 RepID=A0A7S3IH42_9SPIT|mmetsp:Transcript_15418/g.23711  ORF Transcript_15418/g.23711 Transcript_15418/m.23711 type:complete len:410 (+) Transcript_15418:3170-4399(+)
MQIVAEQMENEEILRKLVGSKPQVNYLLDLFKCENIDQGDPAQNNLFETIPEGSPGRENDAAPISIGPSGDLCKLEIKQTFYQIAELLFTSTQSSTNLVKQIQDKLLHDFNLAKKILNDLSSLCQKLNDLDILEELEREAQINEEAEQDDPLTFFQSMLASAQSTAQSKSRSARTTPYASQLSSIAHHLDTIEEGVGFHLSNERRTLLIQIYDKLFRRLIQCLGTISRHEGAIKSTVEIEFEKGSLLRFIERIDSQDRRMATLNVLASLLIEFASLHEGVQEALVALKYERTTVAQIKKQDEYKTIWKIAQVVEKLFDLTEQIDHGEQEIKNFDEDLTFEQRSIGSSRSESDSAELINGNNVSFSVAKKEPREIKQNLFMSEGRSVEPGDSFRDMVVWLSKVLKLEKFR